MRRTMHRMSRLVPSQPFLPSILRRLRDRLRLAPARPPRVTDDGDDGLAGSPVRRRPKPFRPSGAAARAIPAGESNAAQRLEAVSSSR
jgi:hypothetical protein